ncbi:MAG: hypothetical protein OXU51_05825 [Candidatus Poribacteria bacterium]|nr:hypothetical protein [Candidatus Poribacteria bacterium]
MKTELTRNTVIKYASTHVSKHIGAGLLIIVLLCVAYWIRIQGVDTIPEGQFTANDAYLYYWQAQVISEQGHLPARDMHRWVPVGRDLGQTLNLYSYALAYTHKALSLLFPKLTLYQVTLYAPVVCFCIGIAALCFFLYHTYGCLFSITVGVLLATLPGTIERSAAGFCDRDSWCFMLGILAILTYLAALQVQKTRRRLIWTLVSGGTVFLGGLSWEGFGVFLGIILFIELWRFLSSETEADLWYYLLWMLTFVPTLFIVSTAYRRGEGFATHLFAFMLIPPLMLFFIRYLRHFLITNGALAEQLRPHARTLALILTMLSLIGSIVYIFIQSNTFALSTVPLSQNRLMQSVGELSAPEYRHWVFRYGSVFFLGCIGLIVTSIHLWEQKSIILVLPLALFTVTTFFRERLEDLLEISFGNTLFFVSIVCAAIGILLIAWWRNERVKNELTLVAAAAWFLCWVALSRDAIRYDFFIGLPIAFFTTALIQFLSNALCTKFENRNVLQMFVKIGITVSLLVLLMWWTPAGAHARRSIFAARHMRKAIPGNTSLEKTFRWMKTQLPSTACIAANWGDGSQLNVLGGVKTIIDQDHYIQHWIHLFYRHVFCAQSNEEALEFLKTHEVTHLMVSARDLFQRAKIHSFIGSNAQGDREFELIPLQMNADENGKPFLVPVVQNPFVTHINTSHGSGNKSLITATAQVKNGSFVEIPHTLFIGKTRIRSQKLTGIETGGIILMFNEHRQFRQGFYVPPIGWNSLAVRLFFHGDASDVFVPVYPIDENASVSDVKVWEIHYPPDIQPHPKYLATEPEK